jgi:lipoyl synthase
MRRHPEWIRVRAARGPAVAETRSTLRSLRVHTVCEEARCPNLGECWGERTATFMLMGDICTRNCGFCAVAHGCPQPLDPEEPARVAEAAARLALCHVVVTSVDRDDLPDGGAEHFAATAREIKRRSASCRIEVLTPDFRGDPNAIATVVDAPINILNHNVETVPRLYRRVRPGADYARSLDLLRFAKHRRPALLTKSGLMLGLGEQPEELRSVLSDLRICGCDILTLGQYLQPTRDHLPIERYASPDEFADLRRQALALGFRHVESGPLVRSSYHARLQVG